MRRCFASALLASAFVTPLPGFHSPTGNIRCLFLPRESGGAVLCSIRRAAYARALQDRCLNPGGQRGAGVDWHGWRLGPTGRGEILCSGGILYNPSKFRPTYALLAYGRSVTHAGITCTSRRIGVTCHNMRGHGLFVSRASWRTF